MTDRWRKGRDTVAPGGLEAPSYVSADHPDEQVTSGTASEDVVAGSGSSATPAGSGHRCRDHPVRHDVVTVETPAVNLVDAGEHHVDVGVVAEADASGR